MKATAIFASSALIGLSSAACPNGYGTAAGSLVPLSLCIADGVNNAPNKAKIYSCNNGQPQVTWYDTYDCMNGAVSGPEDTQDFDDINGTPIITCEAVDDCDYYHFYYTERSDAVTCGTIGETDAADHQIDSQFHFSGISGGTLNACVSMQGMYGYATVNDGYCDAATASNGGDAITITPYTDAQCTTVDTNAPQDAVTLVAADSTANLYDGNYECSYFVGCSTTDIIQTRSPTPDPTSAPTLAPTTDPTSAPTSDPTTDPTADPTSDPTTAPTLAPTDPTSHPTTDPTSAQTSAPTSAPTANPTTVNESYAAKATTIVALFIASYAILA